jgi:hypothetical protein
MSRKNPDPLDPYAFEIKIRRQDGSEETIVRVARTLREAQRIGLGRPQAASIIQMKPMPRAAYKAWYGHRTRR